MKPGDFVAFRDQLLTECIAIHTDRAAKYASDADSFSDLRASAGGGVTAAQAAYIHLGKHIRAVGSIVAQMSRGEEPSLPADGDVLNNIRDSINYLVLLAGVISEDLAAEGPDA
jgi:hypothetical protein